MSSNKLPALSGALSSSGGFGDVAATPGEGVGAGWRGWVVGLTAASLLAVVTPYVEFYLSGSQIAVNLLPTGPLVVLVGLVAVNLLTRRFASFLNLTPQDLTLVTIMTMITAAIPGYGFMAYLSGCLSGAQYLTEADPANKYCQYVLPHLKDWMVPHDPLDRNAENVVRPLAWFLDGKPREAAIPYAAWFKPYLYWSLMALMLFGMMFTVCSLLRRQWADRERLPFPLAQVPEEIMRGMPGTMGEGEKQKPFFSDKIAWLGIGLPFLLHSWNSLANFPALSNWPGIPLKFTGLAGQYLTSEPWSAFGPLSVYIFPSVIGLTYLLSLEVGFSLWFFYFIQKIAAFFAVMLGLGKSHADFQRVGGHNGFIIDQGMGALLAMVLFGFWMARSHLGGVLLRALGLRPQLPEDEDEALSHRAALIVFTICFVGAAIWLVAAGVGLGWALLALTLFIIVMTGITRLTAEGGLFYVQVMTGPTAMLQMAATPASMGSSFAPLDVWGRVFAFDWGRTSPMPGMMNSLKLASDMRLRKRTVAYALALAVPVIMAVSFYSFFYTVYSHGGAKSLEGYANGWTFVIPPRETFNSIKGKAFKLDGLLDKFDDKFGATWVEAKGGAEAEALAEECMQIKTDLKKLRQEAWDLVALEAFVLREDKIAGDNPTGWHKDLRRLPGALIAAGIYSEAQVLELVKATLEAENLVASKPAPNDEALRREATKANPNHASQIQDLLNECRIRAMTAAQAVALEKNTYRLREFLLEKNRISADEAERFSKAAKLEAADMETGVSRIDTARIFWTAFGAVLMVVFMIIRTRVFWFPHPIGYVTWMHPTPMEVLWFSLLLGWFLKWTIVKYGGFKVYGNMKRFFVGLVVGEVLAAAFWITTFGVTDTVAQTREFYRINIDP